MATQVTGTYGTGIGPTYTYIIKKTLEIAKPYMPLHTLAQKKLIPLNSGKSAQFTRLMHLAPVTSPGTEGSAVTPVKPYAMDFSVTVAEWENAIQVSTLLDDTFITPALEAYLEILGINMGESMQLELQKTLWGEDYDDTTNTYEANVGCIGLVYDASDASLNEEVTATTSGSTTTFKSTALNDDAPGNYDDSYIGGSIVFTNPQSQNYGLGRRIFDYASSGGVVTWKTAVKVATQRNKSEYEETARICAFGSASGGSGASLALTQGTDILKAAVLRRAYAILSKHMALPFREGYYVACVGPQSLFDLTSQTAAGEYIDVLKYTHSRPLLRNEVGEIAGVKIVKDHKPYRLSTTSPFDYSASGGLEVTFVLGRDALGVCGLQGQTQLGDTDTQIIIKRPGSQTTSDPTNKYCTAGWKTTFARLSLNACWAVGIVTYPSSL